MDIRGAGGRVDADSSGGGVTVRFAPGNSRGGDVSSSGGSVRHRARPRRARCRSTRARRAAASTRDLPITIQGKIESHSLRGDMNGGGPLLRLRSSGGGVRITAAHRPLSASLRQRSGPPDNLADLALTYVLLRSQAP